MYMEIADRITHIIVEHLGVKPEQVIGSANLKNDLGADSLDSIELLMACEEMFGVEISDPEAEKINTVQEITELVVAKVKAKH